MRKYLLVLVLLLLNLNSFGQVQFMNSAERSKILTTYGKVVWKQPAVQIPLGKGVGLVASQQINENGAESLRIHFKVSASPQEPTWAIRLIDGGGNLIWLYSPKGSEIKEFWSGEVNGQTAKIEVYSTQENNPLQISVDRIAISMTPIIPQSITVPNNLEPISTQSSIIKELGKSVARLRFVGDDGFEYVCSGFLISADLFMTNQHCPQSEGEWRSTLVDFDFDAENMLPVTLTFKEFVLSNAELDLAIFRLSTKTSGRTPLILDSNLVVTDDKSLLIIQHPAGESKQVSLIGCRTSGASLPGVTSKLTDFGHLCDTIGGSSGSPIVYLASGKIVGLHHFGFNENSIKKVNQSVSVRAIADFIKTKRPDIWVEMGN